MSPNTASRGTVNLTEDWRFTRSDPDDAALPDHDDSGWEQVRVPHEWAIAGPFDKNHDLQVMTVIEDGDRKPSEMSGRTGGLPHAGKGWYRRTFSVSEADRGRRIFVEFDGVMSQGKVYLNGVCMHHDLGPLGAAVNPRAVERQLEMLVEMGCNALRTSHNPPAPEVLDVCDRLGILVIDEAFDEWRLAKCENGYNLLFDEWAEKDLRALIRRDRNHPSVIMWSIGNEIREQGAEDGAETARFLVDICHDEDPTRPTTAGFNSSDEAIEHGLAEIVDVPGWNYKPFKYREYHEAHPEWPVYGSETESCVSTRIELLPDRPCIAADGVDLSFITVRIVDEHGILCPLADNSIRFQLEGPGRIVAVGNGDPTSTEPFLSDRRKAFHGMGMLIVGSEEGSPGEVRVRATSEGLTEASTLNCR